MALTTARGDGLTSINASNISSGTLNSARFSGGKIGQVLQDTTFSAGTSTSSTDVEMFAIGGVSLASTSSKVLLIASCPNVQKSGGDCSIRLKIKYGSTTIASLSILATSSSADHYGGSTLSYLYSPNATSPETFYVTYAREGSAGSVSVYESGSGQGIGNTFTIMEVLA